MNSYETIVKNAAFLFLCFVKDTDHIYFVVKDYMILCIVSMLVFFCHYHTPSMPKLLLLIKLKFKLDLIK